MTFGYTLAAHQWNSFSGPQKTQLRLIFSTFNFTYEHRHTTSKVTMTKDDVLVQLKFKSSAFPGGSFAKPRYDSWGFQCPWYVFKGLLKSAKFEKIIQAGKELIANNQKADLPSLESRLNLEEASEEEDDEQIGEEEEDKEDPNKPPTKRQRK